MYNIKESGGYFNNLRANKGLLLQAPRVITYMTLGDHAFLAATPKLRNSLPVNKVAMRKILILLKYC